MSCLDRRMRQVEALLAVFSDADAALVERAGADAQKLAPLSVCDNADPLQTAAELMERPASPEQRQRVDSLGSRIATVDALEKTGRLDAAVVAAADALTEADAIGYRPAQAEARYHLASVLERLSRWDEAETHLSQALFLADASGHELYRAKAASLYNVLLGYDRQKFEPARRMELQARAAIERLGNEPAASVHRASAALRVGTTTTSVGGVRNALVAPGNRGATSAMHQPGITQSARHTARTMPHRPPLVAPTTRP